MTYTELTDLIMELRDVRARKKELHEKFNRLRNLISNMKADEMVWVNKYTGEVLNPDDWTLYDERTGTFYSEEKKDGNTDR
jgi:hypothetical protein